MTEAPDYLGRVAGVRTWRVAPNLWARLGGLLWANSMLEPWPTGEVCVAHCTRYPDHIPPVETCTCGVHAWYTPMPAIYYQGGLEDPRHVSGIVSGWGEVWLHENGWRAQYGRVEAIFADPRMPKVELPVSKEEIANGYEAALISPIHYEEFCAGRRLILIDPDDL